jgi:hypothetical protein
VTSVACVADVALTGWGGDKSRVRARVDSRVMFVRRPRFVVAINFVVPRRRDQEPRTWKFPTRIWSSGQIRQALPAERKGRMRCDWPIFTPPAFMQPASRLTGHLQRQPPARASSSTRPATPALQRRHVLKYLPRHNTPCSGRLPACAHCSVPQSFSTHLPSMAPQPRG